VDVFDHDHQRRGFAGADEDLAEDGEGPILELRRGKAIEERFRRGESEEVREQRRGIVVVDFQREEAFPYARPHFLFGHLLEQAEVAAHQLEDRSIGDGAAVRDAGRFELETAGGLRRMRELVEQPRLADAGFSGDQDDRAAAFRGGTKCRHERLDFARAPDERRKPALL
jgi:hypothetical protein